MDGEKNLRNPNSHQKSNDKQERRPEGNPNQQKIAETGKAVEKDGTNLELIEQEQKRLVNKQNHKQLKELYESQKKRIQKIKEEIEAFNRRDEDFANTFSGIVRYGDHLKAGGDDVSKRASTLRESVQDVLAMFHEIENTKIDVKEIQELFEKIQAAENLIRQMAEYNANFSKSFEDMKLNHKQQMDSAKNQKSVLKETLEKLSIEEKQKREVVLQLKQDVAEKERKLQNLIALEKEGSSAQELTLEKARIQSQIEMTENELNSFNLESQKLSYDLVLLNSTMMEKKNIIDSLNNLLSEKDNKIEIAKAKLANLSTIALKSEEELKSLKQISSDRETMVTKLKGDLNALKQSNSESNSEVQELEKLLQMDKEKLSSLLEEIKKQEDLESQQLREIEILREKLEQAKQNNASMLNQLNEKKRLGNVKDDQIKKLELKVRQMKSKIQAKREETQKLREEKKASTEKDREVKKLQKEVETLQSTLSKSDQVIQEMTTKKQNLTDENKKITHNVGELEKKLQSAEKLKKELEKEANAVQEEMKELRNAIDLSQRKTSSNNLRSEKMENSSHKKSLPKVVDVKSYPNIDALLRSEILVPTTAANAPRHQALFQRDSRDLPEDGFSIEEFLSGL